MTERASRPELLGMGVGEDDGDVVAALREHGGEHDGRVHPLPAGLHIIGRSELASVVASGHDVSRRHAAIQVGPDGLWIEDLESKNGVYVNGQRIGQATFLTHGERFSIASGIEFEVEHRSSQVLMALHEAGEFTMTRHRHRHRARVPELAQPARVAHGGRGGVALPLATTVVFAALVAWLYLQG